MKSLVVMVIFALGVLPGARGAQPVVAVHDSELTRALESMPASGATPTGPGTTSNQWWTTQWHYFVMPDSVEEALRSDGTAFAVVSDANIGAGGLLDSNGAPMYPIVVSFASEAIDDSEIAPLTNYVAAGGFLLVGSSAFTRNTNGTTRGDFAFGNQMGVHMSGTNLLNWANNYTFSKTINHRIVSHIPGGMLTWQMPSSADEVSWPYMGVVAPERLWQVNPADAGVVAQGDTSPYLLVKPFGKGFFIYDAAMQPLIGHGGYAPGMYAYGIFRNAIEWAFQSAKVPVAKLSPWPYSYDAAFMVRHDLENFQDEISNVAASAQFENANGAKGDYYFCTGTLRVEMTNSPAVIAGLRQATTSYNATIGPHNGGLPNPQNSSLVISNYDYWHWGPDQAFDVAATNLPLPGYPDGQTYAFTSLSNSFLDVEGWLSGLTNGVRAWVAPYFNATREASYQIEEQLDIKITGDDKLGPFPSWTLSTQTPDMHYSLLQLPVSDWYVQSQVAQSMESGHSGGSIHNLVDYYYNLGALINLYSHSLSTGGSMVQDYVAYAANTNLHPRIWPANALDIYSWWLQRSNAQITASFTTNGSLSLATLSIAGATDPRTAVEFLVPGSSVSGLQVFTNGVVAAGNAFRTNGPVIKLPVGITVTNVQISYILNPTAQNDNYTVAAGQTLSVPASGILNNDVPGAGTNLTAVLVSGPAHGALSLTNNGGFTYTPATNYAGVDTFTYLANDGVTNSSPATVTIDVIPSGNLFFDDFARSTNADPLAPWAVGLGVWTITNGVLQGTASGGDDYSELYAGSNWGDYTLQAKIQIPAGVQAWAAGLSGRLNPLTGEKYTANIYPEGSPLASTNGSPVLRLIKFHAWREWSYTPMALVPLPAVDTNWHTLKLTFQGNQIGVYFDGNQVVNVTDNGFDGVPAYTNGAIGAHMYMDTPFVTTFNDMQVFPLLAVPVASNDSYGVIENRTLTVPAPGVLTNDTPGTGTNLTALLVNGPAYGILTLNPNGGFSYTPTNNYIGTDSFTYQANDGVTNSSPATVTITVTTNYPPVANNDSYNAGENRTLTISAPGVLGNDTDANGDSLTAVLLSGPAYGTLNLNTNGGFTYTPATNFVGVDTFNYLANDGWVNSATAATVTITVISNQPPVANNDSYGAIENRTLTVLAPGVLANDTDANGYNLSAILVSGPAHGTLILTTNGGFNYTATSNYVGTDSFTYQANDGLINSALATVTITVNAAATNQPPVANNDSYSLGENTTLTVVAPGVLGNDTDPDGDNLTALLVSGPAHGALNLNASGAFSYVPTTNYTGADSFTYQANDGQTNSAVATVTITVLTNNPPVANNDYYTVVEGRTLTVPPPGVLTNDTVGLGTNLTAVLVSGPAHGTLILNTNGGFIYDPTNNYIGTDTFNYLANDGVTNSSPATVTITVTTNYSPVANNDSYIVTSNSTLIVSAPGVLTNDTDANGDALTAILVSGPAHGVLNLTSSGGFSYTPANNYVGTDSFTYIANDGLTNSSPATVTITVITNLPPVATNDFYTVAENTTLSVPAAGVLSNDADADGDSLTAALVSSPAHGTLNLNTNGGFSYTPSNNFAGMDFFTYQASDGVLNSGTATVTIDVTPPGCLFFDNFTRSANADPLAPWSIGVGQWVITNGVLQGTASTLPDYTEVYAGTGWGDYSVQSRMQFPDPSVWGAGLNGRVNPQTGARYTMMVCPEGSPEAQGGLPVLLLMKFGDWRTWSFTPMIKLTLPSVGTNWHRLKLAFRANQIAMYFDGNQVASVTDNGVDNGFGVVLAYTNGAIGAHAFMNTLFQATFDDMIVRPLVADDSYSVNENTNLSVSAPGVLGNDTAVYGTNLTAVMVTGPANGTLNLSSNGGFSYTPFNNYVGTDSFTYSAYDGQTNLGSATVNIAVNNAGIPVLTVTVDSVSRAYGNTNPPLTGSLAGVQAGDNITTTYATMANTSSPVGTYAIVPVFNDPSNRLGNYLIVTNGGTLTVTQAMLTVSANNATRVYGATNPVFTVSYNGFVNGDGTNVLSGAPVLTTSAVTNSPVGTYAITVGPGTLSAMNYAFSFTNGLLTVGQATLEVSADNYSRAYGATNPVLTASYSGFVNGETLVTSGVTGNPNLTTTANTASPAGNYPITVTNGTLSAANYTFSFVNGTLTVYIVQPTILSIAGVATTNSVISWSAISNVTYRVQYQSDLGSTNWLNLTPDVTATSNIASAVDNPGGAVRRFYRIMIVP